jgi:L-2-hydroxycarboxylate dehydrogenase (NAD+)
VGSWLARLGEAARMAEVVVVSARTAVELATEVLVGCGAGSTVARHQATHLVDADLAGRPSHGLQRLPVIVGRIENGVLDPTAQTVTRWRAGAALAVDGANGFGCVALDHAMGALCERVPQTGIALGSVRRSSHIGMLAPYLERICERGLVGIIFTTSEAVVHPHGGRVALVGTNPVGIGIPARPEPLILDMSTGAISAGEIRAHAARGTELPAGRAVDADGIPTTDPVRAQAGAISPFGGAKGYGLALALELLVAALSHTAMGEDVRGTLDRDKPVTKGDIVIVIDPASSAATAAAVTSYLAVIRETAPVPGVDRVLVPGDRSRQARARALEGGIGYPDALWHELEDLHVRYRSGAAS